MLKVKKKVFVAMSGGVDSSVAAALLKERGFDVAGVFMKFWTAPIATGENKCCSIEAYHDALAVADKLGIKLYTFNFEKEFKKKVVDYFVKSLKAGDTPNPCVVCNREIKFGLLLEKILKLGGDYVATGHYARLRREFSISNSRFSNKSKIPVYKLLKANDKQKDQSYFLWAIKQKQLAKFLFPIGDYKKEEVRKIAKDFGLPVFQKRDSEDLCFVGDHLGGFISHYIKPREGDIVDINGKKIGAHNGLAFYTIGQRKGLNIPDGPWYVYKKDMAKNQLIVVNEKNKNLLLSGRVSVEDVSWIAGVPPKFPFEATVKIRYQHNGAKAMIIKNGNHYIIEFNKPQLAATLGQSAVFYKYNELLGGGVISKLIIEKY